MGWGDAARYMLLRVVVAGACPYPGVGVGEFEGRLEGRLLARLSLSRLSFALGTGAGILNPPSAFLAGLLELGPFNVPEGACAVFILENGLKLLLGLGFSFSGMASACAAAFSALDPIFSYAWKGFLKLLLSWRCVFAC